MTPEARVRAGGVVLVFDAANVPVTKLFKLAKAAKSRGENLRVVIPVTAHAEKLTHLRHIKGAGYDATTVRKALEDAGVEVLPLDVDAAEAIAERLCQWFPSSDAWQDAKWNRLHGDSRRSPDNHPPATIDWYTAALCPPGGIVVTNDTGPEFRGCEILRSDVLEGVLRELSASE